MIWVGHLGQVLTNFSLLLQPTYLPIFKFRDNHNWAKWFFLWQKCVVLHICEHSGFKKVPCESKYKNELHDWSPVIKWEAQIKGPSVFHLVWYNTTSRIANLTNFIYPSTFIFVVVIFAIITHKILLLADKYSAHLLAKWRLLLMLRKCSSTISKTYYFCKQWPVNLNFKLD